MEGGERRGVTAYTGCGVGLVREVMYAEDSREELRRDVSEEL